MKNSFVLTELAIATSPNQHSYAILVQSELLHQKWGHFQSYLQLLTTKGLLPEGIRTTFVSFVSILLPKLQLALRAVENVLQVAERS
jgi:hypothetical protein